MSTPTTEATEAPVSTTTTAVTSLSPVTSVQPSLAAPSTSPSSPPRNFSRGPSVRTKRAVTPLVDADSLAAASSAAASSSSYRRNALKLQSREELRAAFNVFDTSQQGAITVGEFGAVYKMLVAGASDAEIAEVVAALDGNKDGSISFDEFASLMQRRAMLQAQRAGGGGAGSLLLDDALSVFDSGDPALTRLDVSDVLHICGVLKEGLSDDEKAHMLQEMQVEPDGYINYARLVQQMLPRGS